MDYIRQKNDWNHRPLLFLVAFMIVSFWVWASVFSIEQHVRGTGRIVPAGQAKIVQNLEGGIIDEILVHEGQSVEKNQVLMQISNKRAESDLEEQKIGMEGKQVKLARLRAEQQQAARFEYNAKNAAPDLIANEEQIFNSRRSALNEKLAALNEQITQKKLKLADLDSQLSNISAERKIAQDQLDINERLKKSGAVSQSRYLEAKSRVTNFDTRLEQIKKSRPVLYAEIDEIKNNIEGEKQDFAAEVAEEINKTELDIRQLQERMKTQADQVNRTALVSPVKGIVNKIHVTTLGGVIKSGEPLVEIIPMEEDLIVEAQVPARDRGKIWTGLPVMVKVTAYDFALYGGIEGNLVEVSADSFTDERGNVFYRVRISLQGKQLQDKPLYPGMIVNADIISGKITIMNSILRPFWRIREAALREA
ncbi:MAG: HlyD family type I secretion periplasmic adaptor subunit [Alphaproteobacteria bacterium PRO2]|nr:HlyD family type I secretion periplasmic adaptor subunit [Alphaproteobacteria bacterium PRO2]